MLTFDKCGIYCAQAGIYIDPWKPVDKAIITHAHSDHARWGMKAYVAHRLAVPVMRLRLGADINVQSVEYGEVLNINGVKISLHPAGHIWGSAQVRLEYKGEIWVVSGDYKLQADGITTPFEHVKCHSFITESTFGLPVYKFPTSEEVYADINAWWQKNRDEGKNSVILAYALGKAQRVHAHLNTTIGDIYLHGAVDNINKIYEENIGALPIAKRIDASVNRKDIKGAMIIAPPSAADTPWLRSMQPYKLGICSGWMQLRGTRRRRGADRGFVLSDHADWEQLNTAVRETGAQNVYVTHGYKSIYSRWLETNYGLNATEVDTLYTGEALDDTTDSETAENKPDESI
ncbi:DNA ligase-associated DEXH box helicase [Flavipsychrobacter stenotrophus]|uniref:DNA ligase-associated DEXH box helicase n=1 Tax=Flavipsychrobacter stenotrophus TaxID=2077091 RepID=A0A2S7SWE9_9BACT|nr:ligase-associated DNA damage response exonuclease [Flavipsychrobacter stenotrophus]PQJ10915.1 DNA ligase-associated DEXH box helicase [Flavipsychrobacter stenotrophus]